MLMHALNNTLLKQATYVLQRKVPEASVESLSCSELGGATCMYYICIISGHICMQ